ncbi:MAG TPA: DUF2752 domain-containing protein [Stenotrophomonas sp.]|nr:DUF2752 domain-containing protein [Stenotrophomonas sp.]
MVAAVPTAVTGTWLLYRFDPNVAGSPFLPCLFRTLTGFYCPGCGMTRALHALVHLDLVTALRMNPLLIVGLATVPGLVAWKAGWRARWFAPVVSVMSRPNFWLVLLPAYWIARNLPWFPFTALAPG